MNLTRLELVGVSQSHRVAGEPVVVLEGLLVAHVGAGQGQGGMGDELDAVDDGDGEIEEQGLLVEIDGLGEVRPRGRLGSAAEVVAPD